MPVDYNLYNPFTAHGKRSGNSAKPDELPVPEDNNDVIPTSDDTRWFLSKLVPGNRNGMWQRLVNAHAPESRHRDQLQWRSNPIDDEVESSAILRETDDLSR